MTPKRFRDLGFSIGRLPTGPLNAITDVAGVRVGHVTIVVDEPTVGRTGVTAIAASGAPYWQENVFGGVDCSNGFGEVTGGYWLAESGVLTTPVVLSSTFSLGVLRDTLLAQPFREGIGGRFHQPFCGETNDGILSDGLGEHVRPDHVLEALRNMRQGPVLEGNVGGGTGMICHEFKGGIGTSSRLVSTNWGSFTTGVLVQANYGLRRDLSIDGVPVGREIDYELVPSVRRREEGSIIVVVATDAPLLPVQCTRLARRGALGLARVGGFGGNTSGDFTVAFSTANRFPALPSAIIENISMLPHDAMSPLFQGVIEATEEAIVNALVAAETMTGQQNRTVHALPLDALCEVMEKYGHGSGRKA